VSAPTVVIQPAAAAILFTCDSVTGWGTFSPGVAHNQRAESFSSGPTAPAGPQDIMLAPTSDTGIKANDSSVEGSLSSDGTKVAIRSRATNLDPGDSDNLRDIYVKDLVTGEIILASTSDGGVKGNAFSGAPSLAADGRRVAFSSAASNLDPADTEPTSDPFLRHYDIYVKDLTTGDVVLASTSDTGAKANSSNVLASVSADGTKVAFRSFATNLDPADSSDDDVYVKDLTTGDLTLASTTDTGVKGDGEGPSLSADGTRVSFATGLNMDAVDTDAIVDVYVKQLPAMPTSIVIDDCSNGNSGTASIVDIRSYGSRPLGCPVALGGAAGNDYPDTTPILVGGTSSMIIDWAEQLRRRRGD
jgi:hypothetical protein